MRPLHAVLLVLVPALVFVGALDNSFHLDDWYRVAGNQEVERLTPLGRHFADPATIASLSRIVQYRPLLPLSLSVSYALAGHSHSLVGYHLGNLLFHVLAGLLLYGLVRELLAGRLDEPGRRGIALGTALLFAVHPISGVPVNYVCARDLLMMQAFLLGSLLMYVRMRRVGPTLAGWVVSLGLLALSLLSKTNAAMAPLLVGTWELCLSGRDARRWRTWVPVLPFAAVVAGFFAFTRYVLNFSDISQLLVHRSSALEYPLTELKLHLFHYLRNAVWPFFQRPLPAIAPVSSLTDPAMLAGLAVVIASVTWAWRHRRRDPVLAFCVLAYWLMFAPTSSLIPFRSFAADYRAYPSLPFLVLAGCLLVHRLAEQRRRRQVLALCLAWFAGGSIWQNTIWQDEESLWEHSYRHGGTAVATLNYGQALVLSDPDRARELLKEALEANPDYIVAYLDLGWLEVQTGNAKEGLALMRRAVALDPGIAQSHYWYAKGLSATDHPDEAAREAGLAVELDQDHRDYRIYAALCAQAIGDHGACLALLEELHREWPSYGNSRFLEGWSRQEEGQRELAMKSYRILLQHVPDHVQGRFNLAFALMEQGRWREAVEHFEHVLRLQPGKRETHAHLATCLRALGDEEGAAEHDRAYTRQD